jgi:peptidylprolyl isomerase
LSLPSARPAAARWALDKANATDRYDQGRVRIKLRNDLAPQHAERIKLLAREGELQ